MKFAIVSVIVNIAAGLTMFHFIGVPGLAIGTSAAAWVNVVLMVFTLARRKTWVIGARALRKVLLLLVAAAGMAAFCAYSSHMRPAIEGVLNSILPAAPGGGHALSILGHKAIGAKEIAVVGVSLTGAVLYIGLLFGTGAIRPSELKAALRRK
jgi:putative peptidoglycan lipid II flippase